MRLSRDPQAQALIFDVDGTLLDTMPAHHQAWRETMAIYDIDFTAELFTEVSGLTSEDIVVFLARRFDRRLDTATVVRTKDQAFVRHIPLIQQITPVVEFLEQHVGALPLGAATNETFGVSNILLRSAGMTDYFQALVTSDEVERPKPAPDVFLECARRLDVSPAHCQVLEDSEYGLAAARAAGMIVTDVRSVL